MHHINHADELDTLSSKELLTLVLLNELIIRGRVPEVLADRAIGILCERLRGTDPTSIELLRDTHKRLRTGDESALDTVKDITFRLERVEDRNLQFVSQKNRVVEIPLDPIVLASQAERL